jgi:hypothetical protein
VTEADWQSQIIDLARLFGWRVAHFRPAMTKHGWRTAVSADGVGFPDLLLVRDNRLVVAELKAETGRLAADQEAWLRAFALVDDVETHVWRPSELDKAAVILRRRVIR